MPVFQPMVEAVKKVSWLASWNSENHSLLGRSHRWKLKWVTDPHRRGNPCPILKGRPPAWIFFFLFSSIEKRKRIKSTKMAKTIQLKSNRKETPSR
ncbi:hypothetical protein [Echinicola rosea]|uniref:hypothetical protein n=1 Tax=Echinicola rosea TaxID=1807691 RepID=UPI0010CA8B65|nr:hypothetical protein [Echinicola rosea]